MSTPAAEADTTIEIIIMGLAQAGKTTFVQTISTQTNWQNDEPGGWFSGKLPLDDETTVNFLEPPSHRSFDFYGCGNLVSQADVPGYIVLFDSTNPEWFGEAVSILQTIRAFHEDTPLVVAANKQDEPYAWSARDIQLGLGIPESIPVIPCIASRFDSVREVVIQLLYQIFPEA